MKAEFLLSAPSPEYFPPEGMPEVAFLGRSNVGKSSLINCLTGQKGLAKTSSTPGRTQVINFFQVEGGITLVDLPGYGYAKVPRDLKDAWKELIEAYLRQRKALKLCVILLDGRRGWTEKDLELKEWLEFHNRPYLVVGTKWDKLNQKEQHHGIKMIREQMAQGELVPFSAITGRGAREIWQAIWKIKTQ